MPNAATLISQGEEIYIIKEKLTKMLEEDIAEDSDRNEGAKKFLVTINEVLQIAEARHALSRGSSPDSDGAEEERHLVSREKLDEVIIHMHSVKQMKKQVLPLVSEAVRPIVERDFYTYCRNQNLYALSSDEVEKAAKSFLQRCTRAGQGISVSDLQLFMNEARLEVDPRVRLEQTTEKLEQTTEKLEKTILTMFIGYLNEDVSENFLKKQYETLQITVSYIEWKNANLELAKKQVLLTQQGTSPKSLAVEEQEQLPRAASSLATLSMLSPREATSGSVRKRSRSEENSSETPASRSYPNPD